MSSNRELKQSVMLDDSLDWNHSSVAPESGLSDETDYLAFSHDSQDELYLGLFPKYIVNLLKDSTNWKNRVSGVSKIQSVVNGVSDKSQLAKNLPLVLELLSAPMNDTHFKVSQMGLELIECLVKKVGKGIKPHMPDLVKSVMPKVGSNKFVLKQAGMRVMLELMNVSRPEPVIMEVANFGLTHKMSRVREESINTVIAALLSFPSSEFHFNIVIRELCPSMSDSRPKVRQASFEAMTLLCHLDNSNLKEIVSTLATVPRSSSRGSPSEAVVENGLGSKEMEVMDAFYTRISRKLLPTMNEAGLVQHGLQVVNDKLPATTGSDVAWILSAGDGSKTRMSGAGGRDVSGQQTVCGESVFRPYRSAGKRLPWEKDQAEEAAHMKSHNMTTSKMPSSSNHPSFSSSSPQHLSASLPLNPPSTGVRKKGSYVDMHLSKAQHHSPTKPSGVGPSPKRMGSATGRKGYLEALPSSMSSRLTNEGDSPLFTQRMPFPQPNGKRHNTLPDSIRHPSTGPTTSSGGGAAGGGAGYYGPLAGEEHHFTMHGSYMHHGKGPAPTMQPVHPTSMSVTWPRGYGGGGLTAIPPPNVMMPPMPVSLRGSQQQISADAKGAVGSVQNSVKTNVSRPLSKPRVRNPLTSKIKEHSTNLASIPKHTDSPTQIEREFLSSANNTSAPSGWADNSWDEAYFEIPEDTAILNSSLSSSLSSLCAARETESAKTSVEQDKLKHIRREAASRKAQLLSAAASVSNSPEFSRHSKGSNKKSKDSVSAPVTKGTKPKPLVEPFPGGASTVTKPLTNKTRQVIGGERLTKSPPSVQQKYDPDRTYTVESDKTYSMAFAKRQAKLGTQAKRDQTPPTKVVDAGEPGISLEGRGLDRDIVANKDIQPKKKARKTDTHKVACFPRQSCGRVRLARSQEWRGGPVLREEVPTPLRWR